MAEGDVEQTFWEWFVAYRSPSDIKKHHPDFLTMELCCFACTFLTFLHAQRVGGRFKYLWVGVILHGLFVEMVSYWMPDIDSFWHAQGIFTFLGKRLPLYIVCIYAVFIYTASVVVAHSGMKWWALPPAVGLTVVMLDLPYDILGIKNLFWTWHDTDPNIYDRHYWVPWTSYYFHATFACGFTAVFHLSHKIFAPDKETYQYAGVCRETLCMLLAAMFGFPLGVIQFVFIYHPLHDTYGIHTEVCVMLLVVVFGLIVWMGDRNGHRAETFKRRWFLDEIMTEVILHYTFFLYLVFTSKPENNVVTGLHEPVGPCNETNAVQTPFGAILSKKKYLCLENYDEAVFDFHCVDEKPAPGSHWYTICGTPYQNHMEYIVVVCAVCLLGLVWCLTNLRSTGLPGHKHHRGPHIKHD
ncbi:uncharacterized protein LOC128222985 [Mya arenaria]|uniref:uncharacterized protein LOC128219623 n=1 Tax=Mya arenaria TaxID=6604 RepID=UPI0022E7BE5F|nr:uncharacterized protein LOC128219623 [Mya arenaria]XP_052788168.1 uncharacterized protein LOC128222985 [Mya arenaria]